MHRPRLRHRAACRESEGTGRDSAGWGQHSYEAYDSYITTAPTDGQGCRNQIYRCGIFGHDKHNSYYRVSQERAFGARRS